MKRLRGKLFFVSQLPLITFVLVLVATRSLGFDYGDEEYYIASGSQYVKCLPPLLSNPEHPPLAKYLIGLSSLVNPHIVPGVAGFLSVLFAFFTVLRVRGDVFVSVLASFVLTLEVAFVKTFNYALLDGVAVAFASVATYASLFSRSRFISGVLWGASLASKLSTAYPFLGLAVFRLMRRRFRDVFVEVSLAAAVYVASFLGDLICPSGGVNKFVRHLVFVPSYTMSVHSLTVHKLIHGLLVALLKMDIWRYNRPINITLTPGTEYNVSLTIAPVGVGVEVYPWLSGFLLPASAALMSYAVLRFREFSEEVRAITVLTVLSYVNVLHGPIFWYLTLPTYYLALLAGSILSKRTLAVLAIANSVSLAVAHLLGLKELIIITLPYGP